ncbi:MAG: WD40 repeat domain-containing protein [Deltaproteobacteria bacterium]|nr:WD40 repeat domain-containing protein [Deltaproteobacteria bacterium]
MTKLKQWDWTPGERTIVPSLACPAGFMWQEEAVASPDGETVAAVARREDETFTVRVNNEHWEGEYEKFWHLGFGPDNRLAGLAQVDGEWLLTVNDEALGESHAFLWTILFDEDGTNVACASQQDGSYGMLTNGEPWPELFDNANNFALSPTNGKTAAVVQIKPLGQADTETFFKGVFSVAVNGQVWDSIFVNAWTPVFSHDASHVAVQARINTYEYTITVDDKPWTQRFQYVWDPAFDPATGDVLAPVRLQGKWGLARNGSMDWNPTLVQCWDVKIGPDGKNIWAIGAPEYGKFTAIQNGRPWNTKFPVAVDLRLSPDGTRAACLGNNNNTDFVVVVDDKPWPGTWGMAWAPVFSPDGRHVAVTVRKNGQYTVLVDGKGMNRTFRRCWPPAFSSDGAHILIRALDGNAFKRIVLPVKQFS